MSPRVIPFLFLSFALLSPWVGGAVLPAVTVVCPPHFDSASLTAAEAPGHLLELFSQLNPEDTAALARFVRELDQHPLAIELLKRADPAKAEILQKLLYADLSQVAPFNRYAPEILTAIWPHVAAIQMENLCKVNCPFCGFSSNTKGKYFQLSVPILRSIFWNLSHAAFPTNTDILYDQSDPFDFEMPSFATSGDKYFYPDIHRMFTAYVGTFPYVSTAVPRGREALVMEAAGTLKTRGLFRISISDVNRERLSRPESGDGNRSFLKLMAIRDSKTWARLYRQPYVPVFRYFVSKRKIGQLFSGGSAAQNIGIGC